MRVSPYTRLIPTEPFGCFSDSTTQTWASSATAYPITFNTDEAKNRITHSTSSNQSRVYIDEAGTYMIVFSACLESPSPSKHANIWMAVGGVNVARTNTIVELPISGETVMSVSMLYTFAAGQYFELIGNGDVNSMTIKATAAGVNPTRPASPSIIVTVNRISL